MDKAIQALWDSIDELEEIRSQKAISCIVQQLDEWMCDGKFDLVDESLLFDISTKPVEISLTFLCITFSAKEKLKNRSKLFKAAEAHYNRIRPDDAKALLIGLE